MAIGGFEVHPELASSEAATGVASGAKESSASVTQYTNDRMISDQQPWLASRNTSKAEA